MSSEVSSLLAHNLQQPSKQALVLLPQQESSIRICRSSVFVILKSKSLLANSLMLSHDLHLHVFLSLSDGCLTQKGFDRQKLVKLMLEVVSATYFLYRLLMESFKSLFLFFSK